MICKDCAHAADQLTEYPLSPIIPEVVEYAVATHELCDGCDCQHRVDLQVEGRSVRW